jgi:hypothetical protein
LKTGQIKLRSARKCFRPSKIGSAGSTSSSPAHASDSQLPARSLKKSLTDGCQETPRLTRGLGEARYLGAKVCREGQKGATSPTRSPLISLSCSPVEYLYRGASKIPMNHHHHTPKPRCACGKVCFTKSGVATFRNWLLRKRKPKQRIYECPVSHEWHLTTGKATGIRHISKLPKRCR